MAIIKIKIETDYFSSHFAAHRANSWLKPEYFAGFDNTKLIFMPSNSDTGSSKFLKTNEQKTGIEKKRGIASG